ncbi:MAG: 4'-phosphopantetheinyl transferase family protein [Lachnospiraceae bacterium]
MIKVLIADTENLKDEKLFNCLYQTIPLWRREKIDRMRFQNDKCLSLGAWILLREGLREQGIRENEIEIAYADGGKPYLKNRPELFFNLSHSHERVMCILSDREAGCDVEKKKTVNPNVAKRFFHPAEYECMMGQKTLQEREEMFYRLWTLKESFVKMTGEGIGRPFDEFCMVIGENEIVLEQDGKQQGKYFFKEYNLSDGYCYACCCLSSDYEDTIRKVEFCENL